VKVASLKRQLAEIDGQIRSLDFRGREFADLRREVITNESNYQAYLKKSEESRISEDLDRRKMTNINVVEKATPPMMRCRRTNRRYWASVSSLVLQSAWGLRSLPRYSLKG